MRADFVKYCVIGFILAVLCLGAFWWVQERNDSQSEAVGQNLFSDASERVLRAPKQDGVYLVGHEIAMGRWISDANAGNACYWVRRKYDAIVRGEYYGAAGGVMEIVEGDYEVEMRGCGEWKFLGE